MFSTVCSSTNLSGNTGSISSNNPAADVDNLSDAAPVLSGLYSYYIPTSTWKKLRNSRLEPQPRIGHSMLFHPVCYVNFNSLLKVLK